MKFNAGGIDVILMTNNGKTVGWALTNTRYLMIMPKFLPHDAEIVSGSALLTVNAGPQKWFYIPAQKDPEPKDGTVGQNYNIIASESPHEHVHGGVVNAKTNSN
jgi:hypothetical protein